MKPKADGPLEDAYGTAGLPVEWKADEIGGLELPPLGWFDEDGPDDFVTADETRLLADPACFWDARFAAAVTGLKPLPARTRT